MNAGSEQLWWRQIGYFLQKISFDCRQVDTSSHFLKHKPRDVYKNTCARVCMYYTYNMICHTIIKPHKATYTSIICLFRSASNEEIYQFPSHKSNNPIWAINKIWKFPPGKHFLFPIGFGMGGENIRRWDEAKGMVCAMPNRHSFVLLFARINHLLLLVMPYTTGYAILNSYYDDILFSISDFTHW